MYTQIQEGYCILYFLFTLLETLLPLVKRGVLSSFDLDSWENVSILVFCRCLARSFLHDLDLTSDTSRFHSSKNK